MGLRGPNARPVKRSPIGPARTLAPRRGLRGQLRHSRADRVIAFIEGLPITSGIFAGKKMRLRPWQREIVEAVYATDSEGRRMVRTALLTMPRKNGKTQLAAVLGLAHFVGPEAEPRGQVYSAAADREQASLIYREMKAIVEAVPKFRKRVIVRDFTREMEDVETGSIFRALTADAKTKHGQSASFVVYDELAQAPDRRLYDVLTTSTAARSEPLTVVISTQSADPHHVMSELVAYGEQVNAGILSDPSFHATILTAPLDADPWNEATWRACNPALGDFRSLDEMKTAALQAQRMPTRENTFRLLYLNQPVEAHAGFVSGEDWDACLGKIDLAALGGRPCFAGLDLSSVRDLSALTLFFPDDDGAVLSYFWAPADQLDKREDEDKVPYRTWARDGWIEPTPGRSINKRAIALTLAGIAERYDVRGIGFDRWGIDELKRILDEEGIDLPLIAFGQGYKDQGPAVSALEAAILDRKLRHDGNPVLTWNLANVVVETDPTGARKFTKSRAKERIDGAVALTMAIGLHARTPAEPEIGIDAASMVIAV